MADLVPQHAGELGLVVGQRQQAAGHVDIAAGQGEGVDHVAVEQGKGERLVLQLGRVLDPVADPLDIGPGIAIGILPAELGQRLGVLLAAQRLLLLRRQRGVLQLAGGRVAHLRAGGQRQRQGGGQHARAAAAHGSSSSCAGWVTSIIGPFTSNNTPRTINALTLEQVQIQTRPRQARTRRASTRTVKSLRQSSPKLR